MQYERKHGKVTDYSWLESQKLFSYVRQIKDSCIHCIGLRYKLDSKIGAKPGLEEMKASHTSENTSHDSFAGTSASQSISHDARSPATPSD